jgi:hypothetical protein
VPIIQCKECGKDISDAAKACPFCGAPHKKKTNFVRIIIIVAAIIIGIPVAFVIISTAGAYYFLTKTPSTTSAEHPAEEKIEKSGWKYSRQLDEITQKTIFYAQSSSINSNDLHWPYGPGIFARLTVRNHPRYGKDIYMSIDKGQLLCRHYDPCSVVVRFDENNPATFSGSSPSDGSSDIVFIKKYDRFIDLVKKSKTAIIEVPAYQDGNIRWSFEIDSIDMTKMEKKKQ